MGNPTFRRFGAQRATDQPLPGTDVARATPVAKAKPSGKPNRYGGRCTECNVYVEAEAGLLTKVGDKWGVKHSVCPEGNTVDNTPKEGDAVLAQTFVKGKVLFDGIYTVETDAHGGHRTFRLRTQSIDDDFMPGKQILSFLSGPDNGSDYTRCGHLLPDGTLRMWKRHQSNDDLMSDAKTFLDDPHGDRVLASVSCYRCGRTLTVPASVHNGLGPECSKR